MSGYEVVERLRDAMNEHDLEALVDVFDPDVVSETPAHPQRTFRGADQVRRNWEQIFAARPGSPRRAARLPSLNGDTVWSEWDWRGLAGTDRPIGCAASRSSASRTGGRSRSASTWSPSKKAGQARAMPFG